MQFLVQLNKQIRNVSRNFKIKEIFDQNSIVSLPIDLFNQIKKYVTFIRDWLGVIEIGCRTVSDPVKPPLALRLIPEQQRKGKVEFEHSLN